VSVHFGSFINMYLILRRTKTPAKPYE